MPEKPEEALRRFELEFQGPNAYSVAGPVVELREFEGRVRRIKVFPSLRKGTSIDLRMFSRVDLLFDSNGREDLFGAFYLEPHVPAERFRHGPDIRAIFKKDDLRAYSHADGKHFALTIPLAVYNEDTKEVYWLAKPSNL